MGKLKRLVKLGGRMAGRLKGSRTEGGLPVDREPAPSSRRSASWAVQEEEALPKEVDGVVFASAAIIRDKLNAPQRPLLINHWASWCEGCVDELPLLARLHHKWAEKVEFLGVSWENFQFEQRDVLTHVSAFSKEQGAFWPSWVVSDPPDRLFDALEMSTHTIPQIWILNDQGEVVYRLEEVLDEAEVERLEEALKQVTS